MKSIKYCVPILLLCVLLANEVKQTHSQDVQKGEVMETMSYMSGLLGMLSLGSAGNMLIGGLGLLQLSAKIFTGGEEEPLTKADFLKSQSEIAEAIKTTDTHVRESQRIISHQIESLEKLEEMRNDLNTLREAFADNMQDILNSTVKGITKRKTMDTMLDYFSSFRQILKSFVTRYIKPNGLMPSTGQVKLFFDFILSKESIEIYGGDDCHSESTHTKLFKSYIYILKTLTDAYVMAISAHTVQYQTELKKGNDNAIQSQKLGLKLIDQYKTDMKAFMGKAKWALDRASREIRNCGKFELKRGENFESISFAYILPHFKKFIHYAPPGYNCDIAEKDVKVDDYEIDHWSCTDGGFDRHKSIEVFLNSTNSNWPYLYLKLKSFWPWGSSEFFGHIKTEPSTSIRSRIFALNQDCFPKFCSAFKKNAIAISTQIVRAKLGNVITGLRFRIRKNVIYCDIQEGKYVNAFSVDPDTVTWTETPKSNNILYLNKQIRKLELGAVELKENQYLTTIQLKLKNAADGIMALFIGGGNATNNWTASDLTGASYLDKSKELVLSECDNPEQFGSSVKNMISKAPQIYKPYHVSFQATDFKKDFGITTIPYIDTREVCSNPPAPLKGCGMYHHKVDGSGGYVALKLMQLNLSGFIDYKVIEAIDTLTKP